MTDIDRHFLLKSFGERLLPGAAMTARLGMDYDGLGVALDDMYEKTEFGAMAAVQLHRTDLAVRFGTNLMFDESMDATTLDIMLNVMHPDIIWAVARVTDPVIRESYGPQAPNNVPLAVHMACARYMNHVLRHEIACSRALTEYAEKAARGFLVPALAREYPGTDWERALTDKKSPGRAHMTNMTHVMLKLTADQPDLAHVPFDAWAEAARRAVASMPYEPGRDPNRA